MIKSTIVFIFALFLCSCEFLGWDSSGGNNCDQCMGTDENSGFGQKFFLDAPEGYPLNGEAEVVSAIEGDVIEVRGTEITSSSDLNLITERDALKMVQAACDQTASSIDGVNVETDATIAWTNLNSQTASLVLYNLTQGEASLRLIECLEI